MITAIVFVQADVARIPEVAEQIAALADQTADRLGAHSSRGRAGSVCSTAFGAVAVCTSSTGLP